MSRENSKDAMPRRGTTELTGISQEWADWMAHRSSEIYRVTQKKGMPVTYGAMKKESRRTS